MNLKAICLGLLRSGEWEHCRHVKRNIGAKKSVGFAAVAFILFGAPTPHPTTPYIPLILVQTNTYNSTACRVWVKGRSLAATHPISHYIRPQCVFFGVCLNAHSGSVGVFNCLQASSCKRLTLIFTPRVFECVHASLFVCLPLPLLPCPQTGLVIMPRPLVYRVQHRTRYCGPEQPPTSLHPLSNRNQMCRFDRKSTILGAYVEMKNYSSFAIHRFYASVKSVYMSVLNKLEKTWH